MSQYVNSSKWLPKIVIQIFKDHLRAKLQAPVVHLCQLNESICSFRGLLYFAKASYKKTMQTQFRRRILRRLNWVCTVCIVTQKGAAGLKRIHCNLGPCWNCWSAYIRRCWRSNLQPPDSHSDTLTIGLFETAQLKAIIINELLF